MKNMADCVFVAIIWKSIKTVKSLQLCTNEVEFHTVIEINKACFWLDFTNAHMLMRLDFEQTILCYKNKISNDAWISFHILMRHFLFDFNNIIYNALSTKNKLLCSVSIDRSIAVK